MTPKFIYFDLGQVLVHFDRQQQLRQMAEVTGISPEQVGEAWYDSGLSVQYELGRLNSDEAYASFCSAVGADCDFDSLKHATSDIFRLNTSITPVIFNLWLAGFRLGALSNTCASHWEHCTDGRFGILPAYFSTAVLSYEVGVMKPAAEIFAVAAERAGVAPQEIFYTDDMDEHIQAARAFGFDAVQYTGTPALVAELRKRGVRFNY